jgi:hypothetical protein
VYVSLSGNHVGTVGGMAIATMLEQVSGTGGRKRVQFWFSLIAFGWVSTEVGNSALRLVQAFETSNTYVERLF